MKNTSIFSQLLLLAPFVAVACGGSGDELTGGVNVDQPPGEVPPGTETPPGPTGPDPAQCKSREYTGFEKTQLHATRLVALAGVDRSRVKAYDALKTEYPRVLGNTPARLAGAASTFAAAPARWYEEPESNAVALQTSYEIAFDGCLTYTETATEFATAPDAASAATQCGAMARKFWSKTPGPAEVESCVKVATVGAASEPQARRKWAYACASVLTSAPFLSY